MPYRLIVAATDSTAVGIQRDFDRGDMDAYVRPLCRGEPLTPQILAAIPDPIDLSGPGRDHPQDVFDPSPLVLRSHARQIIETLEPGRHTFIPVRFRSVSNRGREIFFDDYSFLHLTQEIDCVIIDDDTRFMGGIGRAGYEKAPAFAVGESPKLDGRVIAGHHFWRGGGTLSFVWFCSDELHARFEAAGITGVEYIQCRVT